MYDTDESIDKGENEVNQYYDVKSLNTNDFNTLKYRDEEESKTEIDNDKKENFLPAVPKKLHFWERIKLFFQSMKNGSYFEAFIEYKSIRFIYRIANAVCIAQGETEDGINEEKEQLERKQPENLKSTSFLNIPADFEYKQKKFFKPKVDNTKNKLEIDKADDNFNVNTNLDFQKTVKPKIEIEQSNQKEFFETDNN